jgi:hypothetical protein
MWAHAWECERGSRGRGAGWGCSHVSAGAGGGGVGAGHAISPRSGRSVGWLSRTYGCLVQVMNNGTLYIYIYILENLCPYIHVFLGP